MRLYFENSNKQPQGHSQGRYTDSLWCWVPQLASNLPSNIHLYGLSYPMGIIHIHIWMILDWFPPLSTNIDTILKFIWRSKAFRAGSIELWIWLEWVVTSSQVVKTGSFHSLIIVSGAPLAHRWPDSNRHTEPGRTLGQAGSLSNHWPSFSAHPLRLRLIFNFQILVSHQS